ncbi:MAG TPA: HIT family protein [Ilumatobacteraceae bacterium]|nr:HIT family protein [Ilumatobacteraceae bacterium]
MSDAVECFICSKHQQGNDAQGGILYEDELVYVGHLHTMGAPSVYRGWLIVETKRHVADLGDLGDDEAAAIGVTVNRVSRVLRSAGAEHVYAFVLGDAVPHLHVHLAPRYADTPREYWGTDSTSGPTRLRSMLQQWPKL